MIEMLCWLLAIISLIGYCGSNFRKSKKNIIAERLVCNISDIIMYTISGGITGIVSCIMDLCKNITFVKFKGRNIIITISSIKIALMVWSCDSWLSSIIILCELIGTLVILYGTAQELRLVSMAAQLVWVFYDYVNVSMFVAITTGIKFCFCLIAVVSYWNRENTSCETI